MTTTGDAVYFTRTDGIEIVDRIQEHGYYARLSDYGNMIHIGSADWRKTGQFVTAEVGDWIVKAVGGGFYVCTPRAPNP